MLGIVLYPRARVAWARGGAYRAFLKCYMRFVLAWGLGRFRMFDRIVREGDHYTRVVQQPNDAADAARLYGECLAKARAEVSHQVAAEIRNALVVLAWSAEVNQMTGDRLVRVLFSLNGECFDVPLTIERRELASREDGPALVFCRAVAEKLTEHLVRAIGQPALKRIAP